MKMAEMMSTIVLAYKLKYKLRNRKKQLPVNPHVERTVTLNLAEY